MYELLTETDGTTHTATAEAPRTAALFGCLCDWWLMLICCEKKNTTSWLVVGADLVLEKNTTADCQQNKTFWCLFSCLPAAAQKVTADRIKVLGVLDFGREKIYI